MFLFDSWRYVGFSVWVMSVGLLMGCGQSQDFPEMPAEYSGAPAEQEERTQRSVVQTSETSTVTTPDAALAVAPDAQSSGSRQALVPSSVPFRVAALVKRLDGSVRVGLVRDSDSAYTLIGIGEQFMGYEVVAIDANAGEVVFSFEEQEYVLQVASRVLPDGAQDAPLAEDHLAFPQGRRVPAGRQVGAELAPGVEARPEAQVFEATPRERELGIDPNDSTTWTPGYRGPAIERAARARAAPQYEQTPDEQQLGIDPNDPATWPSGYRGPGIERMAAQSEQLGEDLQDD